MIKKIINLPQDKLAIWIDNKLQSNGRSTIKSDGNYLYSAGSVPVLLIAHLDTVHKHPPIICQSDDGRYLMSPTGIGGDDRCGVYALMKIAEQSDVHLLFTYNEETGCLGAREFTKSGIIPDVNYIIEIDRKGEDDAVYYDCDNEKFEEFITSNGDFKTASGSCSDISYVAPYIGVAAVNLSSGYFSPHSSAEYIDMDVLNQTIERTINIINNNADRFEYIRKVKTVPSSTHNYSGNNYLYRWYGWDDDYEDIDIKSVKTSGADDTDTTTNDYECEVDMLHELLDLLTRPAILNILPDNAIISYADGTYVSGAGIALDRQYNTYTYDEELGVFLCTSDEHGSKEVDSVYNADYTEWWWAYPKGIEADTISILDYDEYVDCWQELSQLG